MGIRRTLAAIVSSPLATLLEARLRERVDEAVAERDFATASDIRTAFDHLDKARVALDELRAEVEEAKQNLALLQTELPADDPAEDAIRVAGLTAAQEELHTPVDTFDGGVRGFADQVVALRDRLEQAGKRTDATAKLADDAASMSDRAQTGLDALRAKAVAPAPAPEPAPAPKPAAAPEPAPPKAAKKAKVCRVPGCTNKHRARGFCGRHYMQWKRNGLPGFVFADGTGYLEEDGARYDLGASNAGKAFSLVDGVPTIG
jgi:hypothetical protein